MDQGPDRALIPLAQTSLLPSRSERLPTARRLAEKTAQLNQQDQGSGVFRLRALVLRQVVLSVLEEPDRPAFLPVQVEGQKPPKECFYKGAAPNQQAIPAVEYLMSKEGGGAKR